MTDFRNITDGTYDLKIEDGWSLDKGEGLSPYPGTFTLWTPAGKRFAPNLHCEAGLYGAGEVREAMKQTIEDCDAECTDGGCTPQTILVNVHTECPQRHLNTLPLSYEATVDADGYVEAVVSSEVHFCGRCEAPIADDKVAFSKVDSSDTRRPVANS